MLKTNKQKPSNGVRKINFIQQKNKITGRCFSLINSLNPEQCVRKHGLKYCIILLYVKLFMFIL